MFEGAPLLGACVSSVAELVTDHLGPLGSLCGQCGCGTDYSGPLLWEVLVLVLLKNIWLSSLFLTQQGLPAQM